MSQMKIAAILILGIALMSCATPLKNVDGSVIQIDIFVDDRGTPDTDTYALKQLRQVGSYTLNRLQYRFRHGFDAGSKFSYVDVTVTCPEIWMWIESGSLGLPGPQPGGQSSRLGLGNGATSRASACEPQERTIPKHAGRGRLQLAESGYRMVQAFDVLLGAFVPEKDLSCTVRRSRLLTAISPALCVEIGCSLDCASAIPNQPSPTQNDCLW